MTDSTKPPSGPDGGVPEVVPPRLTGEGADTLGLPDAVVLDPSRLEADEDEPWAAVASDKDRVDAGGDGGDDAAPEEVTFAEQEASLGHAEVEGEAREGELDVVRSHLKGLIEALIFASDKPLTPSDIAKTAKADRKAVVELLRELQESYLDRGIRLVEVAGGYAFRTAPAFGPFVRDVTAQRPVKMTRAQLETLAIVAYRQPLTRPEIDDVRGVDSGPVLKMLLERGLVRILGKRDEPGRPLIYGTTSAFLSFFNLKSLKDLPSLREFTELSDDSKRTFEKVLGEEAPVQLDFGEAISGRNDTAELEREPGEADGEAGTGVGAQSGSDGLDSGAESGSGGLNDDLDSRAESGSGSGSDGLEDEDEDEDEDDDDDDDDDADDDDADDDDEDDEDDDDDE
jgi:segregation and condensation protein B